MQRALASTLIVAALVSAVAGPATARPDYRSSVSTLDAATRRLMSGRSWRPGCPVGLNELRSVRVFTWGFDQRWHRGRLVVHRSLADEMVRAFRRLYTIRYPIRQMRLVDHFGADDRRSMAADNTSAFNCRWRGGVCCTWSQHAYGRALDINPVENPYMHSGGFSPPNAAPYVDRSPHRKGMIHRHDEVWWAFRAIGWEWGGDWRPNQDYQHFSANGR